MSNKYKPIKRHGSRDKKTKLLSDFDSSKTEDKWFQILSLLPIFLSNQTVKDLSKKLLRLSSHSLNRNTKRLRKYTFSPVRISSEIEDNQDSKRGEEITKLTRESEKCLEEKENKRKKVGTREGRVGEEGGAWRAQKKWCV